MKKLIILATLLMTACGIAGEELPSARPVATYNNHSVPAMDFLYLLRNQRNQQEWMLSQWMGYSPEDIEQHWQNINEETGLTTWETLRQNVLEQILEQGTMLILAQEAGINYDTALLHAEMEAMQDQLNQLNEMGMDGEQILYDVLGISMDEFEIIQRNALVGPAFVEHLAQDIQVTDAQISEYMEENPHLQGTLQARAVHVLISTQALETDEEIAEAYQQAQDILARINAGENPRELAPIYSDDPGSPDGFYQFPRGQMVPEFEEWAFSSAPGDTGIVETQFGFHVMYSEGHDSLEDVVVRELARMQLISMIEEADIEWNVDYELLETIE